MSVVAQALSFRTLAKQSPVFSLIRSPHAPLILSFLAVHFPHGSSPRPAAEIYELLDADLNMLRSHNFDLPKGPQGYVADWIKAGWLIRKPGTSKTGETLEPSDHSLNALEAVHRWRDPRSTMTASRIQSIAFAVESLARDSDPDAQQRIDHLLRQREQIDQLIKETESGHFHVLDTEQIRERITDILDLASSVPADFARVRAEFEELNRTVRRQLLDPEDSRGTVLDDIFRGVDLIAESEAGRSFHGFYEILLDHERSAHIDSWIASILEREQSASIEIEHKERLRHLFRDMETLGYEVNTVMTTLARSLRHYVTTQDFAENRRMLELLRATRALSAKAVESHQLGPLHHMNTPLTKIGMSISSVSALVPKNPGLDFVDTDPVPIAEVTIDVDELLASVSASEINFTELEEAIAHLLETHTKITIGEVLHHFPATQGLASVVGLLYLALSNGHPLGHQESVSWTERAPIGDSLEAPDEDQHKEITMHATIEGWFFSSPTTAV
ncbi:DUF3375 domain-containing protein [Corynebacterium felinum]|uniref:DUF3375 domain-containing protein n=1 Tax=Corynebacterium felinum TaxID=131318 RepID=A0ABU2BBQ8_9CORY|nr:DUF3375 domain-containing protein [Corynebacterium felinum]MDF5819833.1 DUF3375 domain-containing protein [Corynebacterium felinum]MDR7356025.1 hypothetical protein [Corynebacterium felinum]WJY95360.1 hypothetical protein CFELI_08775 [Corynebacterium felinum]